MTNYQSSLNDYELLYATQTELALGVRRHRYDDMVWLPLSQIQFESKNYKQHDSITVTIPQWLAEKWELEDYAK